jgi:hypothetical protein
MGLVHLHGVLTKKVVVQLNIEQGMMNFELLVRALFTSSFLVRHSSFHFLPSPPTSLAGSPNGY